MTAKRPGKHRPMIDLSAPFDDVARACVKQIDAHVNAIYGREAGELGLPEDRASQAGLYAFNAGGKRVRGMLVILGATACGSPPDQGQGLPGNSVLNVAASIELMHAYSLIHDDLPAMDDSPLRRGQPTVHLAYDEATAVLAGDGLQALAFQLLTNPDDGLDPSDQLQLVRELATAAGFPGMVGGQQLDLLAEVAETPFDLATTKRLQAKKTGALLRYSAKAGAILNGDYGQRLALLDRYGAKVGLAFQIVDDLLDLHADQDTAGKPVGADAVAGKATFIDLMGEAQARAQVAELTEQAVDCANQLAGLAADAGQTAATNQLKGLAEFIAKRHF